MNVKETELAFRIQSKAKIISTKTLQFVFFDSKTVIRTKSI